MKVKCLSLLVLLALLLSPLPASARTPVRPDFQPLSFGVIDTVRLAGMEPGSIDPAKATGPEDIFATVQLFSGLTRYIDDMSGIEPDLADEVTANADSTVFTVTIKPGLHWSDGAHLTAADVKYGILRSLKPSTGARLAHLLYPIQGAEAYNQGQGPASAVGINVVDPSTLEFHLTGPRADFPAVLAMPVAFPQPKSAITAWGSAWTQPGHIVTSGPYRLVKWIRYSYIQMIDNPTFYESSPDKIRNIYINFTAETTAWTMFHNGLLDSVIVPDANLVDVRADPVLSLMLHDLPGGCTDFLAFNPTLPPFDDYRVRQAFMAAINKQALIDGTLPPGTQAAFTFIPPGVFGHLDPDTSGVGVAYSPSGAAALLTAANYPNGVGLPTIHYAYRNTDINSAQAAPLQSAWQGIGASVEFSALPLYDLLASISAGTYHIWRQEGWCSDWSDGLNFLDQGVKAYFTGLGYPSAAYWQNVNNALLEDNDNTRIPIYKSAEEILVESDPVLVPLYYVNQVVITRPYLERTYGLAGNMHVRDWFINIHSSTTTSTDAEDGWILESKETSSIGGTLNVTATRFYLGDNARDRQYRAILSFPPAFIPEGAVVTRVQIRIRKAGLAGTNPFNTHGKLAIYATNGGFDLPSLTLSDFAAGSSFSGPVAYFNKAASGGWYTATINETSLSGLNLTGLLQFRLEFTRGDNDDMSSDYILFWSGDAANYQPQLIIEWYPPGS